MLQPYLIAILAGLIPALLWLLFWIREDRKHPEPKKLLALTFFIGMLVVVPVFKLESLALEHVSNDTARTLWWVVIEELGKFLAAYFIVLRRKEVDEPIDYVIYMVTVALGFAAAENALFISNPLSSGLALDSLVTGNMRFIGATLLHILASTAVGISMAFAFYKSRAAKRAYLVGGIVLAIALHAGFNLTIMIGGAQSNLIAPFLVWIGIIVILLLFEKVKKIHPVNSKSLETIINERM